MGVLGGGYCFSEDAKIPFFTSHVNMRKTDKYQHASIIKKHNVLYSFPSSHYGGEDDPRKTEHEINH